MNFPHHYKSPLTKCEIRIDGKVYDVTYWRDKHPGGAELLDKFHGSDATDAFYALHSEEAIAKLKNIKSYSLTERPIPREELAERFNQFRMQLKADGWMERNWIVDAVQVLLPCVALAVLGTLMCQYSQLLATVMIGIAMQQAGWISHDYCHGRGLASKIIGLLLGTLINGMSPAWWSHKHNTHHCFPNRQDTDTDIHNEPILHLWFPPKEKDHTSRRFQHYYCYVAYSLLYVSWRMQSIQFVLGSRNVIERALLVLNYLWIAALPWKVAVGSMLLGGLLVGVIVTSSHQAEPILKEGDKYNYCVDTFTTTRGMHSDSWLMNYLWGGMQYQLEHHMFPIMPKYRYPKVRPLLKKFAEENDLPFKVSGLAEILRMNFEVMKRYSQ